MLAAGSLKQKFQIKFVFNWVLNGKRGILTIKEQNNSQFTEMIKFMYINDGRI